MRRPNKKECLIIALLAVHLIPVWSFKFIPTQDGISHIYNAYLLKEYNNPEYTKLRKVYRLNVKPFPNWSAHAFFFVTLHIMPPLIGEKLYVTLCVLLLPLSFFYFLKRVDKRLIFFGFLGFLYSFNYLLNMGFYGFALSVSFYFFALGYWWQYRNDLKLARMAILNILLTAIYFCHLFSYAMILLSISLLALTSAVLPDGEARSIKERGKPLVRTIVALLPACLVFLCLLILNPETLETRYLSFKELWIFFVSVRSLVSFNDRAIPLMRCFLGLMGLCFLWTIIKDKIIKREFIGQRDGFLLLSGVSTILYFKLPWIAGSPAWINDRMHLFLFPILLAWFSFTYPKWLKHAMIVIMIGLSLSHLGLTIHDYYLLNKDMEEFTSGAHLIAPNSSVSITTNDFLGAENHGLIKYLSPFYQGTSYYCIGNGSHYVANYEPKYSYFALRYREGYWKFQYKGIIDYMLVWRMDEKSNEVIQLRKDYDLIHETKNLKLFRHKSSKIDVK